MVNPEHFDFGLEVIRWISNAVTISKLRSSLEVTKFEKVKLLESEELKENFLEVTKGHEALEKEVKLKVLKQILEKVANVKINDVVTQFGREKTGRGVKDLSRALSDTRAVVELIPMVTAHAKKMIEKKE